MSQLSLIAALAQNGVIGKDGDLPWHLPRDLGWFKAKTRGKAIVMGRKTWESLPKALPKRRNVVITGRASYRAEGAEVFASISEALAALGEESEVVFVGGSGIYREALTLVQTMYLTHIEAEVEGDTHFPPFSPGDWDEVESESHPADERHRYACRFVTYARKQR